MREARYSTVAVVLHWAIALLILGQIAGGWFMEDLPNASPIKFDLYQLHKSFGISILALTLARLGWRLTHRPPALPAATPGWQKGAARATHWLFYFLLLATPLLGLAMVSVSPKDIPTQWFGLFGVPHLDFIPSGADPAETERRFMQFHRWLAYGFLGLLALHVGAALKHGFADRDGVLRSMAPAGLGAVLGILFIFIALSAGAVSYYAGKPSPSGMTEGSPVDTSPAPTTFANNEAQPEAADPATDAPAPDEGEPAVEPIASEQPPETEAEEVAVAAMTSEQVSQPKTAAGAVAAGTSGPCGDGAPANWAMIASESRLRFVGSENGRDFTGSFADFSADIAFDPNALDASWIDVVVQTATASTGDQLRDSTITGGEWFDVEDHPTATFRSCDIREDGDGGYEAVGTLSIKDAAREIVLPFTVEIDDERATARGQVELARTNYNLGAASSWLEEEGVALEVRVEFEIAAERIK